MKDNLTTLSLSEGQEHESVDPNPEAWRFEFEAGFAPCHHTPT